MATLRIKFNRVLLLPGIPLSTNARLRAGFRKFFQARRCFKDCTIDSKLAEFDFDRAELYYCWDRPSVTERWNTIVATSAKRKDTQFVPGLGRLVIGVDPAVIGWSGKARKHAPGLWASIYPQLKGKEQRDFLNEMVIREPFGVWYRAHDMRLWHVALRLESTKSYQSHIKPLGAHVSVAPRIHIYPYGVVNIGLDLSVTTTSAQIMESDIDLCIKCHPRIQKDALQLAFKGRHLICRDLFQLVQSALEHALFAEPSVRLRRAEGSDWVFIELKRIPEDVRCLRGLAFGVYNWQRFERKEIVCPFDTDEASDSVTRIDQRSVIRLDYFWRFVKETYSVGRNCVVLVNEYDGKPFVREAPETRLTSREHPRPGRKVKRTNRNLCHVHEFVVIKRIVFNQMLAELRNSYQELVELRRHKLRKLTEEEILRLTPGDPNLYDLMDALDHHTRNLSASQRAFYSKLSDVSGLSKVRDSLQKAYERLEREIDRWEHPLGFTLKCLFSAAKSIARGSPPN